MPLVQNFVVRNVDGSVHWSPRAKLHDEHVSKLTFVNGDLLEPIRFCLAQKDAVCRVKIERSLKIRKLNPAKRIELLQQRKAILMTVDKLFAD